MNDKGNLDEGAEGSLSNESRYGDGDPEGPSTCVATPEMLRLMDSVFLEDALQEGFEKYCQDLIDSSRAVKEKLNHLGKYFDFTRAVIKVLEQLKSTVNLHNAIVLAAKTSGTAATTLGTVVGVTGIALAPFTLSSSLTISAGAAASVGGAATSLITSWWDASAKTKIIDEIQVLAKKHRDYRNDVNDTMYMVVSLFTSLMEMGLSQQQAFYVILHEEFFMTTDDKNGTVVDGTIDETESWIPLTKFCFSAGYHAFRAVEEAKEVAEVAAAGGRGFLDMFRFGSRAAAGNSSTGVISQVSKLLALPAVKSTLAAFGVVFTTLDIALLVHDWNTVDPTVEGIENVLEQLDKDKFTMNTQKVWKMFELVKNCDMVLGWIGDIPVVGTSPFAVEGLLSFYAGDFEKLRKLYGVAYYQVIDSPSIKSLNVGFASPDLVRDRIQEYRQRANKASNSIPHPTYDNWAKPTNGHTFWMDFPEQDLTIGLPLFNPNVLRLNKDIIDAMLRKGSHPSVEELRQYLDLDFLEEYDDPLPEWTVRSIKNALVCTYKYKGHIDANKWEYNVTVETLKEHASSYFNRQIKLKREMILKEVSRDDPDQRLFGGLLKCLMAHKSFTDRVAVAIWMRECGHLDGRKKYQAVCGELTKYIVLMDIKLSHWTYALSLALDKYRYNNPEPKPTTE